VPVLRASRAELGKDKDKDKGDAIVKRALRDRSKQLIAAIGDSVDASSRRKFMTIQRPWNEISGKEVEFEILRHDEEAMEIEVTRCVRRILPRSGRTRSRHPRRISTSRRWAKARSACYSDPDWRYVLFDMNSRSNVLLQKPCNTRSITSSAGTSNVGGNVIPSAFAVLRP
jgi:hypothetical protein